MRLALVVILLGGGMLSGCAPHAAESPAPTNPIVSSKASESASPVLSPSQHDPVSPGHTAVVPFRFQDGHLYSRARINGADVGWYLIDTGAALTTVSSGVVGRLEIPEVGQGRVRGIGGVRQVTYHAIDSFPLGAVPLPVDRLAAVRLNINRRGFGYKPAGLLGFSALRERPFTLDFVRQRLVFHPDEPYVQQPGDRRVAMAVRSHLPMIQARIGGHTQWLILDTGQSMELVLPQALLDADPSIRSVPVSGRSGSVGVGGAIATQHTWTRHVDVLGVKLQDVRTSFERHPPLGVGRIGMGLLQHFQLTVDSDRRVIYARWLPEQ